jgi:hypothetical protein
MAERHVSTSCIFKGETVADRSGRRSAQQAVMVHSTLKLSLQILMSSNDHTASVSCAAPAGFSRCARLFCAVHATTGLCLSQLACVLCPLLRRTVGILPWKRTAQCARICSA